MVLVVLPPFHGRLILGLWRWGMAINMVLQVVPCLVIEAMAMVDSLGPFKMLDLWMLSRLGPGYALSVLDGLRLKKPWII